MYMTFCLHLHDLNFVVSLLGKKECEMCLHESWTLKHVGPKRFSIFSSLSSLLGVPNLIFCFLWDGYSHGCLMKSKQLYIRELLTRATILR